MNKGLKIIITRFYAVYFVSVYAIMIYNGFPGLAGLFGIQPETHLYKTVLACWFFAAFTVCFCVVERIANWVIVRHCRERQEDDE